MHRGSSRFPMGASGLLHVGRGGCEHPPYWKCYECGYLSGDVGGGAAGSPRAPSGKSSFRPSPFSFFGSPSIALVRTVIEIYEDFDLELPVNTINFVMWPGAIGVAAATFAPTLLMCGMPWLPYPKAAAWLASLLFLAVVLFLATVAIFAVVPLVSVKLVLA